MIALLAAVLFGGDGLVVEKIIDNSSPRQTLTVGSPDAKMFVPKPSSELERWLSMSTYERKADSEKIRKELLPKALKALKEKPLEIFLEGSGANELIDIYKLFFNKIEKASDVKERVISYMDFQEGAKEIVMQAPLPKTKVGQIIWGVESARNILKTYIAVEKVQPNQTQVQLRPQTPPHRYDVSQYKPSMDRTIHEQRPSVAQPPMSPAALDFHNKFIRTPMPDRTVHERRPVYEPPMSPAVRDFENLIRSREPSGNSTPHPKR